MSEEKRPGHLNQRAVEKFLSKTGEELDTDAYVKGIVANDRILLGKAITLIESENPIHQSRARELVERCLPYSGKSYRIGITGVPGVGKSTFIERLGQILIEKGHKLAVLAIDPSSIISAGSILGDKTRMEKLTADDRAFIRPSPAAGSLGGVASRTRESMLLLEAAGYDVIFVETVGVGQSETAVRSMVDVFLLLMLAGAGDELQGIKRGITELADLIAINKADSDNIEKAKRARLEFQRALHLYPTPESGWSPKVLTCSAIQGDGMQELWDELLSYKSFTLENDYFKRQRKEQNKDWLLTQITDSLRAGFFRSPSISAELPKFLKMVQDGSKSPPKAAQELLDLYRKAQSS